MIVQGVELALLAIIACGLAWSGFMLRRGLANVGAELRAVRVAVEANTDATLTTREHAESTAAGSAVMTEAFRAAGDAVREQIAEARRSRPGAGDTGRFTAVGSVTVEGKLR